MLVVGALASLGLGTVLLAVALAGRSVEPPLVLWSLGCDVVSLGFVVAALARRRRRSPSPERPEGS